MWEKMKKFIVLFLVSSLTQNLSAAVPANVDYENYDRTTAGSGCCVGTDDWLGGPGPMQSQEDAYRAWEMSVENEKKIKVKATIFDCLKSLPEALQKAVLEEVAHGNGFSMKKIDGFKTPTNAGSPCGPTSFSPASRSSLRSPVPAVK